MECRKHNRRNQQGVCPSCLREKLCRLSSTNDQYYSQRFVTSNIDFSNYSFFSNNHSSDSSSTPSAAGDLGRFASGHHRRHQRGGSMSFVAGKGQNGSLESWLKKSRSTAFVPRDNNKGKEKENKKKKGFWSKLLHLKGKKGVEEDHDDGFVIIQGR